MKMDVSAREEMSSFKMLGLSYSKLDWGSYSITVTKTESTNLSIHSLYEVFFLFRFHYHTALHGMLLSFLGWCS